MTTAAEMRALLAVSCPWCGAGPGTRCHARRAGGAFVPPSTLAAESHDARWQAALGRPAAVIADAPTLVAAGANRRRAPLPERPW